MKSSPCHYGIVHNDGCVEMYVRCPHCNQLNHHTITHATIKNKITIDFTKLGSRVCDNLSCLKGGYSLYK